MFWVGGTHRHDLHVFGDAFLPGKAEDVWQVEGEVDDAAAGSSQVGLVKEDAEQEALHDGGSGEREQKEEKDDRVAVVQNPPSLKTGKKHTRGSDTVIRYCNHINMYVLLWSVKKTTSSSFSFFVNKMWTFWCNTVHKGSHKPTILRWRRCCLCPLLIIYKFFTANLAELWHNPHDVMVSVILTLMIYWESMH